MDNVKKNAQFMRYKITSFCFVMLSSLVIFNGFLNEKIVWAKPSVQALVIIIIPITYYVVAITVKGVNNYLVKSKDALYSSLFFMLLILINIFTITTEYSYHGLLYFIEDGMLATGFITVFMSVFELIIGLTYFYQYVELKKIKK